MSGVSSNQIFFIHFVHFIHFITGRMRGYSKALYGQRVGGRSGHRRRCVPRGKVQEGLKPVSETGGVSPRLFHSHPAPIDAFGVSCGESWHPCGQRASGSILERCYPTNTLPMPYQIGRVILDGHPNNRNGCGWLITSRDLSLGF